MRILLIEATNIEREVLQIQKTADQGKYLILRGYREEKKLQIKGTYDDLGNALGVYCQVLRGFVKDFD